ncbi:MAG: phosphoribosylamine--glycine ligase, partial [Nitrosopumilales archaeon]|nr:phosphoribosylamine--glycine ligase [Nitrosopumilales archaeon]
GNLSSLPKPLWKKQSSVCVVMASKGYPEAYPKGEEITGLDLKQKDAFIFHAGTKKEGNKILTNGGRVLGVTALGDTLSGAILNAYSAAGKIHWQSKYYRKDIGKKGLAFL